MINKLTIFVLLAITTLIAAETRAIEEPEFDVVASSAGVEFRRYKSYAVAETLISSEVDRNKAANTGFRRLFKYISGENRGRVEIAMTAPVQQTKKSTKISMTAPVRQRKDNDNWSVAFVLPAQFDASTAPVPTNPEIAIREIPGELVAALRYSGRWTASNVSERTAELMATLAVVGVTATGEATAAYYNSPFSLPFMRRNEILVVVDRGLPFGGQKDQRPPGTLGAGVYCRVPLCRCLLQRCAGQL